MLKSSLKTIALSLITLSLIGIVHAWTEPTLTPPSGNTSSPLTNSSTAQAKSGGLWLNSGGAATGLIVEKGNVGIGTITPTAKLEIGGTAGVDGIKFPDGTVQTSAVGISHGFTKFTANGSFTVPAGVTTLMISGSGGGGGGGGEGSPRVCQGGGGGGGGASAVIMNTVSVTSGQIIPITVGSYGNPGSGGGQTANSLGSDGGAGGRTKVGTLLTINGGGGGGISRDCFSGGAGGSAGGIGGFAGDSGTNVNGGSGGATFSSLGGLGSTSSIIATVGGNYGGGGGGGFRTDYFSGSGDGERGAPGFVIIQW